MILVILKIISTATAIQSSPLIMTSIQMMTDITFSWQGYLLEFRINYKACVSPLAISSASGDLGTPSLDASIVPACRHGCSPSPCPLGRLGPFSRASTSSCHRTAIFQACPALRAPRPSRAFNRTRSPPQVRRQARMPFLFQPNHPSASGHLNVSSFSPSPAASAAITSLWIVGNLSFSSSPISATQRSFPRTELQDA